MVQSSGNTRRSTNKLLPLILATVICLRHVHLKPQNGNQSGKNCTVWKEGVLSKTLRSLCILHSPDVRLITVNGSMLTTLKEKKMLTLYHPEEEQLPYGVPKVSRRKKRGLPLFRLCHETPGSIFVLVDDNENLVYEIRTLKCEDGCYIGSGRVRLGNCVTKKKTIELMVSDGCSGLKPKVIEVGCNCECMKYIIFF